MKLIHGDCLEVMPQLIDEGVKVDLILTDLPYNETGAKWDNQIDIIQLFTLFKQLITERGVMAFTGTFKFGVKLYNACPELYKYDWIWEKESGSNSQLTSYQPYKIHEQIFIFSKGRASHGKRTPIKYNPQKTKGKPYIQKNGEPTDFYKNNHPPRYVTYNTDGLRHPKSIQKFNRARGKEKTKHTSQKPVKLLEYFIKTYTDEGDTVLDCCMGSGSTGVACQNLHRDFIGIELDEDYFKIAENRILKDYQGKLI